MGYDIRGVYGKNLTDGSAALIGGAFGSSLPEGSTIYVASDPRTHSPPLLSAFVSSVTATGVNVVDVGMAPTPLLTYVLATHKNSSGAVITASHNPPQYNGIKLYYSGLDLSPNQMQSVGSSASTGVFRKAQNAATVTKQSFNDDYVNFISSKVKMGGRPIKVVVDTGNGACGLVAGSAYTQMGCDVTRLYWEPDGTFPNHLANPHKEETLDSIKREVVRQGADLGIALDVDGDRCAFIDELGRKVRSDDALGLFARQELASNPGSSMVYDIRLSNAFPQGVQALGGTAIASKCGRTFVGALMRESESILGGEQTGHTFFRELFYHDDAIFCGAKMLQLLSNTNEPLSKLVDGLVHYPCTPELRISVDNDYKYKLVKQAEEDFAAAAPAMGAKLVALDGVRLDFPDGSWGLLRVSNTEPAVTLRFEGTTIEGLITAYEYFRDYLSTRKVVLPSSPPS
jgi:phosphomannomutase/phosphoglucomutase